MSHLLVAISPHGYGHLAQVAPVINCLRKMLPPLRLTLRTALPESLLRQRIDGAFELQATADDFGMLQREALEADVQASLQRYREFHENWPQQVERVAQDLDVAKPDLLLADIPYLTLAAAAHAGIPAVAMCSVNWHAIVQGYLSTADGFESILQQMQQAYASARVFLRPEPSMPMPGLDNLRDIGVVANAAKHRREELLHRGCALAGEKLLLVAMGGIAQRLPIEQWPVRRSVRYIVPASWGVERSDCTTIESCNMAFSDLLASSDVILTKPGYGAFTEAAVNGIAVLYLRRPDWPEEHCLVDWLTHHARCMELTREMIEQGAIEQVMLQLLDQPPRPEVIGNGVIEAAEILRDYLVSES